jgi:hypothetical protein
VLHRSIRTIPNLALRPSAGIIDQLPNPIAISVPMMHLIVKDRIAATSDHAKSGKVFVATKQPSPQYWPEPIVPPFPM